MITRDKIAGAVYGTALGDAMGRPTEFMSLAAIRKQYGSIGWMALPRPALFTDDTQMTLAVGRALATARSHRPREYVRTLTNEFLRWRAVDDSRAPGASCLTALSGLQRARRRKMSWTTGTTLSRGCGANMRVVPTALLPSDHAELTQLQAAITHGHPVAIAAAELTAYAVRYAAQSADIEELPRMLWHRAQSQRGVYHGHWLDGLYRRWPQSGADGMALAWEHMTTVTKRVSAALALRREPDDICRVLGGSWVADEAYATGLYHAVKYGLDPRLAISMAARTSGDSDSIACIAGAIVGAHAGARLGWPDHWMDRIERRDELEELIDQTWARWAR